MGIQRKFLGHVAVSILLLVAIVMTGLPITPAPAAQATQSASNIEDVPLEVLRRAQQFLEEMRNSPLAPGWDNNTCLNPDQTYFVEALYRPDLKEVAYYEFRIFNSCEDLRPKGFVILSAGEHDFPIAHWRHHGDSPTQELMGVSIGSQPAQTQHRIKFYKLDTLAYAMEDGGKIVNQIGSPLPKIQGYNADWVNNPPAPARDEWQPDQNIANDQNPISSGKIISDTNRAPATLVLTGWEGATPQAQWEAMLSQYAAVYAPLLQALRNDASHDWQIEKNAKQFGEVLALGDVYDWPLLDYVSESAVTISGAGKDFVETTFTDRSANSLPPLLRIEVTKEPSQNQALEVKVNYPSIAATEETGKFIIAATPKLVMLPLITTGASSAQVAETYALSGNSIASPISVQGAWGPWTYYWAGTANQQRYYTQIPKNTSPNNTSCPSGCGATAWAMLFGWADFQAGNGNSYWAPRWGIYRQNGGKGADAIAPSFRDAGITNITWEIRNHLGTGCIFGNAPTVPWDMIDASKYLVGRSGAGMRTTYNWAGFNSDLARERARNQIRDRGTPAIIGTGWFAHYPLAWGYSWRSRKTNACFICPWQVTEYSRWFYVNQGWGGSGDGWVSAGTWFSGELFP